MVAEVEGGGGGETRSGGARGEGGEGRWRLNNGNMYVRTMVVAG